mmetsp:Transcript_105073/g.295912  ORF Transcript_105073/g.295912 Transcript_105073/m.295912 type:complete len:308 (+) Transcript_105073:29-952(+)
MACRLKIFSNVPAERKLGNVRQALRPQCFHHGGVVVQIQAQIVFDCHDLLRAVVEHHQKTRVGRVCAPQLAARDVPRVAHHQLPIIVGVDRRAHPLIVLDEFLERDGPIRIAIVMLHELPHRVVGGHLSALHRWVLRNVVSAREFPEIHDAGTVDVQDRKGLLHPAQTELAHAAADSSSKLVVTDASRLIEVELREQRIFLSLTEPDVVRREQNVQGDVELFFRQLPSMVTVDDAELVAHGLQGFKAARTQAKDLSHPSNGALGLVLNVTVQSEHRPAELLDCQESGVVDIVAPEKGRQRLCVRLKL